MIDKTSVVTRPRTFAVYIFAFVAAGFGTCALPTISRGSDGPSGIAKLFDLGAKSTPPAVAGAKDQHEQLKRLDPKDPRIDYAYGLVLVNQHKYRDALPLLSRYLDSGKREPSEYLIKIWAELQDRKIVGALEDMAMLSRQFPRAAAAEPDPAYCEIASFLGAAFGYLDLVRPDGTDAKLKSQKRNEVLAQLGAKYLPAFDEGRNTVIARLDELQTERKSKEEQVTAAAEKRLQQDKSVLEEARTAVAAQQETIQSSAESLQDAQRELAVIRQQLSTLSQDRARLTAQIITLQAQGSQAMSSINNSTANSSGFNGFNNGQSAFSPQVVQARAATMSLAGLNKQAFNIDRQMLALQGRATALFDKGAKASETVAQSEEAVRKSNKQAKGIEKKLRRPESASKTRAVMPPKMTSLATYIPFPYDDERERVLNWFTK